MSEENMFIVESAPRIQGWGRLRFLFSNSKEQNLSWQPFWLSLKNNCVSWFNSPQYCHAEGNCYVSENISLSDEKLDNGEHVIQMKVQCYKGLAVLQIAMPKQNIVFWKHAFDLHLQYHGKKAPMTYCFYEKNKDGSHGFNVIAEIHVEQSRYSIEITTGVEANTIADEFIAKHSISPKHRDSLTAIIFSLQKQLFSDFNEKYNNIVSELSIKVQDLALAEKRAELAESHANVLATILENLQYSIPSLVSFAKSKQKESDAHAIKNVEQYKFLVSSRATSMRVQNELEVETEHSGTSAPQPDRKRSAINTEFKIGNKSLGHQNLRLRREILEMKSNIEKIKVSAVKAIEDFQFILSNVPHTNDAFTRTGDAFTKTGDSGGVQNEEFESDQKSTLHSAPDVVSEQKQGYSEVSVFESALVEERIIRSLFCRYVDSRLNNLSVSRFMRCARECGFTSGSAAVVAAETTSNNGGVQCRAFELSPSINAFDPPVLDYGEICMIFTSAVKNDSLLVRSTRVAAVVVDAADFSTNASNASSLSKDYRKNITSRAKFSAMAMNFPQFLVALETIAVRLFSDSNQDTMSGATSHYSSATQKFAAVRAAFKLLLKRKIIPSMTSFGLMPWGLMSVELAFAALRSMTFDKGPNNFNRQRCLWNNTGPIVSWFIRYSQPTVLTIERIHLKAKMYNAFESDADIFGINYERSLQLFRDFGVVPFLVKEPLLLSMFKETHEYHCQVEAGTGSCDEEGILPNEFLAQLLHSLVRETESLIKMKTVFNKNETKSISVFLQGELGQIKLNLTSFVIFLSAVAIQAFADMDIEERIQHFLEWLNQNDSSSA